VRKQVERFLEVGYNYILANPTLPGLPHFATKRAPGPTLARSS